MEMQISRDEIQTHWEGPCVNVCNSKNVSYKLAHSRITVVREKILSIGNCGILIATNVKSL